MMATTISSKLRPKLVKDGFDYTILRSNLNDIRWKCSVTTCKGKITTNRNEPYNVYTKFIPHNHDPKQVDDMTFCAINNVKSDMKQCAIYNTGTTNQILSSISHSYDDTICSKLGKSDALRQTIRRARRKYVPDESKDLLLSLPDKWETTMDESTKLINICDRDDKISIDWSHEPSCSTSISSHRSIKCDNYHIDSSLSIASSQTDQKVSNYTSRNDKLQKQLLLYKQSFKEISNNYILLKEEHEKLNHESSTLHHFHLLCEKFLKKGVSNFIKFQSQLVLTNPNTNSYPHEIKQFALMVHFLGPKVYQFLQKSMCLPTIRTLRRVTENWEINPGLNDFLFKVLSIKANSMSPKCKECVLCVNEMSLKSFLFYNFKRDEIIGFHDTGFLKSCKLAKSVMVFMISGLHDSWNQPISYFFVANSCTDYDLKNIIFNLIFRLDVISLKVQVMISDLGSNLKKFEDQMNIAYETPYFNVGDKEIVFMFDPPHLLKTTRNNFFKYRFQSGNQIVDKSHLQKFYDFDKSRQHRLAPKLTDYHMNPNSFQKTKVKYAAQIFSQTVVAGMGKLLSCEQLSNTAIDTINFIDLMDKLFDIFNSHSLSKDISGVNKDGLKRYRLPFTNCDFQIDFLNSIIDYLKNLKLFYFSAVKNEWVNTSKMYNTTFIYAWLVSIAGLIRLYLNQSKSDAPHLQLLTHRLNQDCLQNFFETVRNQNGNRHKPTCIQFKRTFKKLFYVNYFERIEGANCIQDFDDILNNLANTPVDEIKALFPEKNLIKIPLPINDLTFSYKSLNVPKKNALTYICGYLMVQCLKYHECPVCIDFACSTTHLSKEKFNIHFKAYSINSSSEFGNLMMPNSTFYQYIFELDDIFKNRFISLAPQPKVGQILRDNMFHSIFFYHPCKDFPKSYLINLFVRLQIYYTLHRTNKDCHASCSG